MKLNINAIVDEFECCCYCGDQVKGISCCGENHFDYAYVMENGEVFYRDRDNVSIFNEEVLNEV